MVFDAKGKERRQFGRRTTFLHGWVRSPGRPPVTCIVHNMSDGGANLEFATGTWIPFKFRLVIESEGFDRDCEVRHQRGSTVGVCFLARAEKRRPEPVAPAADVGNWFGKKPARSVRG